ncbi:MAG: DUF4230 domain-containing protein [Rhodothermales bacterium]|nr:DUF4230 domain-containing protein [Rhodothermales bacterium]
MPFLTRLTFRLVTAATLLVIGAAAAVWFMRGEATLWPRFTESEVQNAVITTLQRESPAAFLITGRLDITADITEANTKYLLPEYFDKSISLGTTLSMVRLPGVATYGIDLAGLSVDAVEWTPDSVVVITIAGVTVHAVEPHLDDMMVHTEVGWARMSARSGRTVERQAIVAAQDALRREANAHLDRSTQPLLNTEAALQALLAPVLQAVGITTPRIRVRIAPALVEDERAPEP